MTMMTNDEEYFIQDEEIEEDQEDTGLLTSRKRRGQLPPGVTVSAQRVNYAER